jgi:O-antigen/teichoic acid export membrane protein
VERAALQVKVPGFLRALPIPMATLFVLDGLANVIDFAFYFWMGRSLFPSDFASLQTLNAVILVYVTASGVFQPVISRFVAEARGRGEEALVPGIFQTFLGPALGVGLGLGILILVLSGGLARLFNLPVWSIQLSAALILLSTLRPVAAGVLQGRENFARFGFTRLVQASARILLGVVLVRAGLGLVGAVIALPFGWLVSVLCAFLLLGRGTWRTDSPRAQDLLRKGWVLSAFALLAYFAFMSLTSLDLVWVNRNFGGQMAGAYSVLVLMRRIIALLPGVAVLVMYPRVAKALAEGRSPARLLAQTAVIIVATGGALTLIYFVFGNQLITLIFGAGYHSGAPLIGWMGLAMLGVSLAAIWLSYYLAEKPRGFVLLLGAGVGLEWLLLNLLPPSLSAATLAFGATGWLLALGGLLLYLFKSRGRVAYA